MQGSRSDNVGVLPAFKLQASAAVAATSSNTNGNANSVSNQCVYYMGAVLQY